MIARTMLYILIVLVCSASVTSAGGLRPGFRLLGGYGSLAFDDLNNAIDRWNVALTDAGFAEVSTHGPGVVWGFDVCLNVHRRVLFLLSYDRTPSRTDDRVSLGTGFFRVRREITGKFVSLGVIAYPKAGFPAYVLAKGGYGFGHAVERYEGVADPSNFQVNRFGYDVDGKAIIGEIGLGTSASLTRNNEVAVFLEGTYRWRNLGVFDGTVFHNNELAVGELVDDLGNPIDFDYSGFALRAGIEIFFSVTGVDPNE